MAISIRILTWALLSFGPSLFIVNQLASAAPARPAQATVMLDDRDPGVASKLNGIAEREMFRQAFLIAAQDGMGIPVRDSALGETAPTVHGDSPCTTLNLKITPAQNHGSAVLTLQVLGHDKARDVWSYTIHGIEARGVVRLPLLAHALEPDSRGVFIAALEAAGLKPHPPTGPGATVTAQVRSELYQMNYIAQFGIVRSVDDAIQAHGPSPEALSVLARAYANLGHLTDELWTAYRDVFKARAELYSYRLAALYPNDPRVPWTKAYVNMMIGLPMRAVRQVAMARKQFAPKAVIPVWTPWVKEFADYNSLKLYSAAKAGGAYSQLAFVLAAATVDRAYSPNLLRRITRRSMNQADPDCFYLIENLENVLPIGLGHQITSLANKALVQSLCLRVPTLPGIPKSITDFLRTVKPGGPSIQPLKKIIAMLQRAGDAEVDSDEPSWQSLAALTKATALINCERRLEFLRFQWAVGLPYVRSYLMAIRPLLHRSQFWPLLKSYGINNAVPQNQNRLLSLIKSSRLRNQTVGMAALRPIFAFSNSHKVQQNWERLLQQAYQNQSVLSDELDQTMQASFPLSPELEATLCVNDPYSTAINLWKRPQTTLAYIRKHPSVTSDPTIIGEVGFSYYRKHNLVKALSWLKKFSKIDLEVWGMLYEANIYRREHKSHRYMTTMRKLIASQDAVGAADTEAQLANYLMNHGHYRQAEPLAASGAETWACDPMLAASRVYEHLGDFADSEKWIRRAAKRYRGYIPFRWYFWCRRTGHGNPSLAALNVMQNLGRIDRNTIWQYPAFIQMTGHHRAAMHDWASYASHTPFEAPWAFLHAAALADTLKRPDLRDRYLRMAISASKGKTANRVARICGKLAHLMQIAIKSHSALNLNSVRKLENRRTRIWWPSVVYVVGCFEQCHGSPADAKRQYLDCIRHFRTISVDRTLATLALRKMGVRFNPETGALLPITSDTRKK